MTIDLDAALKVASFALSIGAMVYAFFVNRRKDVDARFGEGAKRMDRHEARIASVEQSIAAMPDADDIHAVQLSLAEQTGALREIRAIMDGNGKVMARLEAIVSRHEDHLLNGGKS